MAVCCKAYAKINLGLRLIEKQQDGYHRIETIFHLISLHDVLTFTKTRPNGVRISCSDPSVPLGDENLVSKTYQLLKQEFRFKGGLDVYIEKQIPAGGGLGGGSSDAATALYAYQKLWNLSIPEENQHRIASQIGSDVPFFIYGVPSLGEGRGDRLTPLVPLKAYWVILICPGFSVSTQWAYSHTRIALTNAQKISTLRSLFSETEVHAWRDKLVNELEGVVFSRHPELHDYKVRLYEQGAFYASMSGSGSTLFGLFESQHTAQNAVSFFSKFPVKALLAQMISDRLYHDDGQKF
jgi:4-diphosphocytidyl-2-C-methyl-D-erythritol kinase